MPKSNDLPDALKRVVLPPRRRFATSLPKEAAGALATVPAETSPKLPMARPSVAAPPVPPQETAAPPPVLPPPGIAPVSGIPQSSSFSAPSVREEQKVEEKIEDTAKREKEEVVASHVPSQLTFSEPDSPFEEEVEPPSVGRMSSLSVYLSLAASLVALGIQIWMLLSVRATDN